MKLLLKDFQNEYLDQFVRKLRQAAEEAAKNELQAVSLSSPTGSGKTAMVTAAIERILEGDDEHRPDRRATFLWITDQPELNEQTRRKMFDTSSVLGRSKLVVIDASFDEETFKPGIVYFLNTQKLGKEKYLVTPGDDRTFTIWETITNTVNDRPGAFYVFIDEAHRGMTESTRERNEANTIIQKFIKGSPGEIPRIPLIAGISATPERFNRLIEGSTVTRTSRPVVVDPEAVRASGLLKEIITLYHPTERQPSDMTMLRAAARSWQGFCKQWAKYGEAQGEPAVRPILVVQVQDGSGKQLSRTDIAEAIEVIDDEVGPLPATAFAHSFQEGSALEVGEHQLRYLAPVDIQLDSEIHVIFFKTSLNTGWDCPRAEVMMSFRTAIDATYIAQLVGRMVRTPLARRIDSDEFLNIVALYLPHYDEEGLEAVIAQLTTPDPDILPPVRIEKGEDMVVLNRARRSEKAFAALAELPSYVIPRSRKTSQVRRLMKLARALAHDEIRENAPEKATDLLVRILRGEYRRAKRTKQFKTIVEETEKLDVRAVSWRLGEDSEGEVENIELEISTENIEDIFDAAGRKVGEGLHKAWWRARVEEEPRARRRAKLELFALCSDPEVIERVESTAQKTVQAWLKEHRSAIDKLPEARQQAYGEVRRLAAKPEITPLNYPNAIEFRKGNDAWKKHLFVDEESDFPATFDSWERKVITPEIDRDDVIGWLRNIDRKPWALCVPYQSGGECKAFYPDFLVIRSTRDGLVVDLLDPHSIHLEDAPAKAAGLAQYAALHGHNFDRIELIIVDGDRTKRIDLTDERTREKVQVVATKTHLQQLFDWGPSGER